MIDTFGEEQRLESWKDLRNILDIYGIEERNAEIVWKSIKSPVMLSRRNYRLLHPDLETRDTYLKKIVRVWEKGNRRFVLWDTKALTIADPNNRRYNYLDEGFHAIENTIIRSASIPNQKIMVLRKLINIPEFRVPLMRSGTITEKELDRMIQYSLLSHAVNFREHKMPSRKENMEYLKKCSPVLVRYSVQVKKDRLVFNGKPLGIAGMEVMHYLDFHYVFHLRDCYITESVLKAFVLGLLKLEKAEIEFGAFSVKYTRKGEKAMFSGMKVTHSNIEHLLLKGLGMKSAEEFARLQAELERVPVEIQNFLEGGIIIRATSESMYSEMAEPEFASKLDLEYDNGKWYVISPVSKRKVMITKEKMLEIRKFFARRSPPSMKDPVKFIRKLMYILDTNLPVDILKILAALFGEEEAIKIMKAARKNVEEAEKRGAMLLKEVLEKYSGFVSRGSLRGRDGFIVKGKIRNYFVRARDAEAHSYPEGRHICVVENDMDEPYTKSDRIVSRIMLLINDDKLSKDVGTLEFEEQYEDEDMDFDEV